MSQWLAGFNIYRKQVAVERVLVAPELLRFLNATFAALLLTCSGFLTPAGVPCLPPTCPGGYRPPLDPGSNRAFTAPSELLLNTMHF